jgi:predicted SAM-dependent methyltransferase
MKQIQCLGWQVEGIELSESAASIARENGFKVQTSSLEKADLPSDPYDMMTAWMVLEHLHQPVQCLRMMRSWVKPDGYLVASVPDAESLAKTLFKARCYDLQLPTHLFHYTPKTLEIVLNKAGWKLERVVWQKNCNTLLWSAEYWAEELQHPKILKVVRWLRTSSRAGKVRLLLGWLLGVTHQSGRIEIWARPM